MTDISEGIKLFNNADFFAAHDYFEDLWIKSNRDDKLFYQGMVQISVGSFHLTCGNYKGALSQYRKGTNKLKMYVPYYKGVNIAKVLNDVSPIIEELTRYFDNNISEVDREKIPTLEYNIN